MDIHNGPASERSGHLEQVTAPATTTTFHSDTAGRLARLERPAGDAASDFLYDGRSFLTNARADSLGVIFTDGFEAGDGSCWTSSVGSDIGAGTADCSTNRSLVSVYSFDGLLHAVTHFTGPTEESARYYFYFAGRPVAQLDLPVSGAAEVTWLSVDHLGTPVLATDGAGAMLWEGGFEPFGADYSGASVAGVDLRFPGQWVDGVWGEAHEGTPIHYNLHRWHEPLTGRYSRVDPISTVPLAYASSLLFEPVHPYTYALQRPLVLVDPEGLLSDDPVGCVTRWISTGAAIGAGLGSIIGGTTGGVAAGAACTPAAPGLGTVACGSVGAAGGGFAGAVQGTVPGALAGGLVGILDCTCDLSKIFQREREPEEIDCRKIKQLCIEVCTAKTLPTGTLDGAPFFKCLRNCLESFGC